MNLKAIVPLGLAAVLGLVAMFLVRNAINHRNVASTNTGNTVAVVVAKRDADPGTPLTRDDLTVARLPADSAPGQVFSNPELLVGRVMQTPLVKGQTILETLLAPNGSGSGLQSLIPPGFRAVTIEVNEYTGVGGMLQPGCRVDLVSVLRDDKSKEAIARTVLQNIKISAIGRSTSPVEPTPGQPLPPPANSVTILCTPQQVQTLQLASMSGRPWLVLRSTRDGQEVAIDGTTLSEVIGKTADAGDNTEVATNTDQTPTVPTPTPPNTTITAPVTTQPAVAAVATPATTVMEHAPTVAPVSKWTIRMISGETESTQSFAMPAPTPAAKPMDVGTDQSEVVPGSK